MTQPWRQSRGSAAVPEGTWIGLGLPYPQSSGYGHSTGLSMVRTPFPTEYPSYRRNNQASIKSYALEFYLTLEQLRLAEALLTSRGYTGFAISLLDPQEGEIPPGIRLTDKYAVKPIGSNLYNLSIIVEGTETCDSYLALFDHVVFPELRQWSFPFLDGDSSWGVLGDPWDDPAGCQ